MITHPTKWESYMAAGVKAYQPSNYPEAEKQLEAAVKEAEGFGPQDPRLAGKGRLRSDHGTFASGRRIVQPRDIVCGQRIGHRLDGLGGDDAKRACARKRADAVQAGP